MDFQLFVGQAVGLFLFFAFLILFGFLLALLSKNIIPLDVATKSEEQLRANPFHVGWYRNFCQVLGTPLLWLVPIASWGDDPYNLRQNTTKIE